MGHMVNFSITGSVGLWDLFVTKNNSLMKIQDTNVGTGAVINKTTWPVITKTLNQKSFVAAKIVTAVGERPLPLRVTRCVKAITQMPSATMTMRVQIFMEVFLNNPYTMEFPKIAAFTFTIAQARTALLLRTEMTISRAVKLRALFQEVTLALPEARSIQIWYQMKDMDTVCILILYGLL